MNGSKEIAAVTDALSGARAKKLRTREIHVRKGHAGGFIARHEMEDEEGNAHPKRPEYPLVTLADLQKHMQEHMSEEASEGTDEPEKKNA